MTLAVGLASASLVAIAPAGIIFTLEDAGVEATTVSGVITETFDNGTVDGTIGTYSNVTISSGDVYGGAGGTSYLDMSGTSVTRLDLFSPQNYFGMWWSAGDFNDQLRIYDGATVLGSYQIWHLFPFLGSSFSDYFGNPNSSAGNNNPFELYAYLNFTTTGTSNITKIEFSQTTRSGGFETDNHSVLASPQSTPLTGVQVPDTGSLFSTFLLAIGSLFWAKRRCS